MVSSMSEPDKKFEGVYVYENGKDMGDGRNRDTILWKPSIYTVPFDQSFIDCKCPKIRNDFVNQIYGLMRNRTPQPVYGKLGYSIIKTRNSINKHLDDIYNWDFFYDDGNVARNKAIINDIDNLNCYVIEEGLDQFFETKWENILKTFISEMKNPENATLGRNERRISVRAADELTKFIFMMYCRSPQFDGLGIYTQFRKILPELFGDTMVDGEWHAELYNLLYKKDGGHFNRLYETALKECQMVFYETYEGSGTFITSDNPVFVNKTNALEVQNTTGIVFPLTPNYLVFICRGNERHNVIGYRMANADTVRHFNRMVFRNKVNIVISKEPSLEMIL